VTNLSRRFVTGALALAVALGLTACEFRVYPVSQEEDVLSTEVLDDLSEFRDNFWLFYNDDAGTSDLFVRTVEFVNKWAPGGVATLEWTKYREPGTPIDAAEGEFLCDPLPVDPQQKQFCEEFLPLEEKYNEVADLNEDRLEGFWIVLAEPTSLDLNELQYSGDDGFVGDEEFPVLSLAPYWTSGGRFGPPEARTSGDLESMCGLRVIYTWELDPSSLTAGSGTLYEFARTYGLAVWLNEGNHLIDCGGDEDPVVVGGGGAKTTTAAGTIPAMLAQTGADSSALLLGSVAGGVFMLLGATALLLRRKLINK
jgi:hypothetical protein